VEVDHVKQHANCAVLLRETLEHRYESLVVAVFQVALTVTSNILPPSVSTSCGGEEACVIETTMS
jgi:hypothetical protein